MDDKKPERPFIESHLRPPYAPDQEPNPPLATTPPGSVDDLARKTVRRHDQKGMARLSPSVPADSLSRSFTPGPDVQWTMLDGEAVVVNLENGYYYSLNRQGSLLWEMIQAGARLDDVLQTVCDRFDVSHDVALGDLSEWVEQLLDEGLIVEQLLPPGSDVVAPAT